MPRIAPRRQSRSCLVVTTPARSRKISTIGNSNASPNDSATSITNVRYRSPVSRGANPWPAKPRRKFRALGSVQYATSAPSANSSTEETTNGIAIFRSRRVRPGTMNAQS